MNSFRRIQKNIISYSGSGLLHLTGGDQVPVTYEIQQFNDGNIYVYCHVTKQRGLILDKEFPQLTATEKGDYVFCAKELLMVSTESPGFSTEQLVLRCTKVEVSFRGLHSGAYLITFCVANLETLGNRKTTFEVNGFSFEIRPLADYENIIQGLKSTRGIDVTAEINVSIEKFDDLQKLVNIVDSMCVILSLAQGCRVSWLYYKVATESGMLIASFHGNAITKPFGTLPLIPQTQRIEFINQTYAAFLEQEPLWDMRKAIVAFTDAKIEVDYLEFRALKMAIMLEYIKGRFLEMSQQTRILDQVIFEKHEPEIKQGLEGILNRIFDFADKSKINLMLSHVRGLNWYPFRRALSELCKKIGLSIKKDELNSLIDIRNELVHRASFHESVGTEFEQYSLLMEFVGKILLAILRYEGPFYDKSWNISRLELMSNDTKDAGEGGTS